jgi:hypothetical protein
MLARALRIQLGQRDFKKQSGSGEAKKRLDCFAASAFRLRSLTYGGQVARCSEALLTSKTNRGLRQGS